MPIETANYISDLVPTNPLISDNIVDGPSHFWLIKKAIQNTFPNIKGAIEATQDQLNTLTGLLGSSTSDGLDLKGNLTVEGTTLVPSVTDWTQKQAVPASDADGRYLQTSTANTQTVSGPVTFAEKLLTPNVDDWTSNEPVPAAQADGRYVTSANDNLNARVNSVGINTQTNVPWMHTVNGFTNLQIAGDYANNSALTAEIKRATNADSNLQASKVNKSDGSMSALNVQINGGSFQMNNTGAPGYAAWYRQASDAWDGIIDFFSNVGGPNTNVLRITSDGGVNILGPGTFQKNGSDVAFQSDLPLDPNKIILAWSGYVGAGDQSIPYPRGVSSVDCVVVVCSKTAGGSGAATIINVQGWNNSSVQVNTVWVAGKNQGAADTNYRAILVGNK